MAGNMRRKNKGRERPRKRQKLLSWLSELFLYSLRKMHRGTKVEKYGLATTVERKGTSSKIDLKHLSRPGSMSSMQAATLEERLPPEV